MIGFNLTTALNWSDSNQTIKKPPSEFRHWEMWEYALLSLLIFALVGNTLTILVMRSKRMRTTNTALFLTCMAMADIFVLTIKFLVNMQKLYKIPVYSFCVVINMLPDVAALCSYWLIMITTVERTIAVWYPLKVSQIFSRKRCYITMFIFFVLFVTVSSTQIVCLKPLEQSPHYCGIRGTKNGPCKFYLSSVYPWIKSVLMSWIPSLLGIVLNILIVIQLTKSSRERKLMSSNCVTSLNQQQQHRTAAKLPSQHDSSANSSPGHPVKRKSESTSLRTSLNVNDTNRKHSLEHNPMNYIRRLSTMIISLPPSSKERQITIMLCTISITFVLFTLPYAVYEILRKVNPQIHKRPTHRAVLFCIDCLHATNFILYVLTGKKFRDELLQVLKCRSTSHNKNNNKAAAAYNAINHTL